MSADRAQKLRGILDELFAGRSLGRDVLAKDAEWVNPPDAVEPGTRHGVDGFNRAIRSVFATWDDVHFDIDRVIEDGDHVIALGVLRGHVHAAGMEVEAAHGQVWTFRDCFVTRMQWFNTHAEALDAAGGSLELVRSAFAAWNRHDIAAFTAHAAPDIVWVEIEGRLEGGDGERHGRDRMRQALESLFEVWESYRLEIERLEPAGNRVLAIVREIARGRSSGVEIDSRWGYLITVEDGAITRVEAYRDPDDAVRVGQSEP